MDYLHLKFSKKYYPEYTGTEAEWIYAVSTNNVCALFGHKEVIDEALDATCTKNGLTRGSHCEVCEKVLIEQEVIEVKHNYINDICSICGCDTNGLIQKTYDEIILVLENAFANGKEQNYWHIKTFMDGNPEGEYIKTNSPSDKFTDALFNIHHEQSTLAHALSFCTQSDFILTAIDEQITITTTDWPEGLDSAITLTFVIENELIRSYEILAEGHELKAIFTYEE